MVYKPDSRPTGLVDLTKLNGFTNLIFGLLA